VSYAAYRRLRGRFRRPAARPGQRLERDARSKGRGRARLLKAAAALADSALETVVAEGLLGRSEAEIAWAVEQALHAAGAEAPAFPTIVAAGPHGALPHAVPGDRVVADGDLVVIDMGARLDGYHSDITRTFGVGRLGADQARRLRDRSTGRSSRASGRCAAASLPVRSMRRARRGSRRPATASTFFSATGTGHGVGLEIHEGRASAGAVATGCGRHLVVTSNPASTSTGSLRRAHRGHGGSAPAAATLTLFAKELRIVG